METFPTKAFPGDKKWEKGRGCDIRPSDTSSQTSQKRKKDRDSREIYVHRLADLDATIKLSNPEVAKETELVERDKAKMLSNNAYASVKCSTLDVIREAKDLIRMASSE